MARIHLDQCLNRQVTPLFAALGHDVVHAHDLGMKYAKDYAHLLFAAEERRVLVTNNADDFALSHGAWFHWAAAWGVQPQHAGVLLIPQIDIPSEVVQLTDDLLRREDVLLANTLFSWDGQWYVGYKRGRQPLDTAGGGGTAPA